MEEEIQEAPGTTYGLKLVGIDFNPSGDARVFEIKTLSADVIDGLSEILRADPIDKIKKTKNRFAELMQQMPPDPEVDRLFKAAISRLSEIEANVEAIAKYAESAIPEVLVAQMLAVKSVTYKG